MSNFDGSRNSEAWEYLGELPTGRSNRTSPDCLRCWTKLLHPQETECIMSALRLGWRDFGKSLLHIYYRAWSGGVILVVELFFNLSPWRASTMSASRESASKRRRRICRCLLVCIYVCVCESRLSVSQRASAEAHIHVSCCKTFDNKLSTTFRDARWIN